MYGKGYFFEEKFKDAQMSGFPSLLPRCDLTGRPRKAELRFVCNEAALTEFIGDIFEPQSCEYTMVVFTNKICSVPHLRCDLNFNQIWGSCTEPGSTFKISEFGYLFFWIMKSSVSDPEPDPYVFCLVDPDPDQ
jgi:hypothetical protein